MSNSLEKLMYCNRCGCELPSGARYCCRCGAPVDHWTFSAAPNDSASTLAESISLRLQFGDFSDGVKDEIDKLKACAPGDWRGYAFAARLAIHNGDYRAKDCFETLERVAGESRLSEVGKLFGFDSFMDDVAEYRLSKDAWRYIMKLYPEELKRCHEDALDFLSDYPEWFIEESMRTDVDGDPCHLRIYGVFSRRDNLLLPCIHDDKLFYLNTRYGGFVYAVPTQGVVLEFKRELKKRDSRAARGYCWWCGGKMYGLISKRCQVCGKGGQH